MDNNLEQDVKSMNLNPVPKDETDSKPLGDESDSKPVPNWLGGGTPTPSATMPIHLDSDVYNMKHKERGRAVIFNNKEFRKSGLGKRNGTDADRDRLHETLITLGFNVQVYNDATKRQILDVIENLAAEDHSNRDCVLVAVFSHGDRDLIHAYDDDYKPSRLWDAFDANLCPTLAGKPKIFLIQACQGDQLDGGTKMIHQAGRTMVDSAASIKMQYTVPNKADFLMIYSTFPGYYSWRNTTTGSWFIQALCGVLNSHYKKRDFLSMLTIVARNVAFNFESFVPGSHMDGKKQIPLITSTLTREINFY